MKIDYDSYKKDLITVLQNSNSFGDYNYTGSNINILLDILSRNAHNYGFYANMLMRESSPLTAQRVESLKGYATRHGYLIRNNSASFITLHISLKPETGVESIYIPKDTKFSSVNETEQSITFVTMNDFTLTKKDVNGNIYGDIIVHQGEIKTDILEVSHLIDFYKINDARIDINTLKVVVKDSISGSYGSDFKLSNQNIIPSPFDNVYYLVLRGQYYELYFGNDSFGKQPKQGQFIKIEYLRTMGSMGNGATDFKLSRKASITNNNLIDYYNEVSVTTSEQSSGGYTGINIENLQIALSNYSRVKSVTVNDDDYKAVILSNYNDIESIAVWGGEKNDYRQYGKLFVSIKPKYGRYLSTTMKEDIKNYIVKNYSMLATNIMFKDPQYVIINLHIVFNKNSKSINYDNNTIKSDLLQKAQLYNSEVLGKFDLSFNENDFIDYLSTNYKGSYTNLYIKKELEYTLPLIFGNDRIYKFNFKNPLLKFKSEVFLIDGVESYYSYDKDYDVISPISLTVGNIKFKDHGSVNLVTGEVELLIPNTITIKNIKLFATPIDSSIEANYDRILQLGNVSCEVS